MIEVRSLTNRCRLWWSIHDRAGGQGHTYKESTGTCSFDQRQELVHLQEVRTLNTLVQTSLMIGSIGMDQSIRDDVAAIQAWPFLPKGMVLLATSSI